MRLLEAGDLVLLDKAAARDEIRPAPLLARPPYREKTVTRKIVRPLCQKKSFSYTSKENSSDLRRMEGNFREDGINHVHSTNISFAKLV